MLREPWLRLILWIAVTGLMAVIFLFSAQSGPQSNELTEVAAIPIVRMLASWQNVLEEQKLLQMYQIIGMIVRKIAHWGEYALLGLLIRLLAMSYGWNEIYIPIATGVLYAVSDEVHQLFVPARTGLFTDVLLDAAGICCGVLLVTWIKHIRRKKNVQDSGAL